MSFLDLFNLQSISKALFVGGFGMIRKRIRIFIHQTLLNFDYGLTLPFGYCHNYKLSLIAVRNDINMGLCDHKATKLKNIWGVTQLKLT